MTYKGQIKNGIAVLDTPCPLPEGTPVLVEVDSLSGFRSNKTVDDLVKEQGTVRTDDLKKLVMDWPAEDSLEELQLLVRNARR
jgi:hypothetical protein